MVNRFIRFTKKAAVEQTHFLMVLLATSANPDDG